MKFTYETRISSEDFCKNLVAEHIKYDLINGKLSDAIIDSKWYFLSWGLDPTVSAMLNMLDTIHDKFRDVEIELFEKLEQEVNVTFQFLPLEQFKLTDELYIKMNARGKPLTEFENFKANFSQYLTSMDERSKLDNEWLDIFWHLEKDVNTEIVTENVDRNFFTFFKNITINFYAEDHDIDKASIDTYDLFDIYEEVYSNETNLINVVKILDALMFYDDSKKVFKSFLASSVSYWQRLRFYALTHFFIQYGALSEENVDIFKKWTRVTNNLINNTLIQSSENYKNAIRSIMELSKHMSDIYQHVSASYENIQYFSKRQREEEGLKAELILEDQEWENIFVEIEAHSYFDGQIGFILEYSINNDDYEKITFIDYAYKLSELFGDKFREKNNFIFQRALLAKGAYLPQSGNSANYTFCIFEEALRTKIDNWRKVFNDGFKTAYLKKLLNDIDREQILESLKKIITIHTVSDWRQIIIANPETIAYCQRRQIRKDGNTKIYLLSKSQMNGRHRELFSWYAFKNKFENKTFEPFAMQTWYWESTSYEEPCIILERFIYDKNNFQIEISHKKDNIYRIEFVNSNWYSRYTIPETIKEVLEGLKFNGRYIEVFENEIESKIGEICEGLKAIKLI